MGNNCTRSRKKSGPGARKETAAEEAQRINAAKAAEKNANGGRGRRRRRSSVRENFSSSKEGFIQTMILQALRRHRTERGLKSLNSILMKFTKVEAGMMTVRETFKELEKDGTNAVTIADMPLACEKVGLDCPEDIMGNLLSTGADQTDLVSFKEFIVTLALIFLIQRPNDGPDDDLEESAEAVKKQPTEFMMAVDTVVDAFNFFDGNSDGVVGKEEVLRIFNTASVGGGRAGKGGAGISVKRFEVRQIVAILKAVAFVK